MWTSIDRLDEMFAVANTPISAPFSAPAPAKPAPSTVDTTGISAADLEVIRQMELLRRMALLRRMHFFVDVPEAPTQ